MQISPRDRNIFAVENFPHGALGSVKAPGGDVVKIWKHALRILVPRRRPCVPPSAQLLPR